MRLRTRPLSLVALSIISLLLFTLSSGRACAQLKPVGNGGPGPVKADHLTVELVSARPEIAQGGDLTVGLVFSLEEGWHVYWINAGDSGEPPHVQWTLPKGITADSLQFPIPQRLPLGPLMDFGYQTAVTFPIKLTAEPAAAKPGKVHLAAKVSWLVCKNVCIPGRANLGIDLKLVPASAKLTPTQENVGPLGTALTHLPKPLPEDYSAKVIGTPDEFLITLQTGSQEKEAEFYPFEADQIFYSADQTVDPLPDGLRLHVKRSPDLKKLPEKLHGLVKLNDDEAYEITVPVVAGVAPAPAGGSSPAGPQNVTVIGAISLAFLGGIILNLMPCVFPVLFLKALSLVHSSTEERSRLRNHGFVYAIGIVVSFWAILSALLLLRAGGSQFGWGFQMQSPPFVAVLALFLFFFALSLAGFFEFGLTLTSVGGELAQKQGYAGSFFTGVLAVVVATPCTAPLMGAAIGFALTQPVWITFAIFTALALGLAVPYVVLSAVPAWTRILPRPGAWMEVIKQLSALVFFATVIWLVSLYGRLLDFDNGEGIDHIVYLLGGLLIIAIAAWVLHRWPAKLKGTIVAIILAIFAVFVAIPHGEATQPGPSTRTSTSAATPGAVWQPYTKDAIATVRAAGRPVFVDFTAAWCLSCQVNERLVLRSDDVLQRFKKSNVVLLKADWTRYDPQITAELSAVGRSGVPTYVIYPAKTSDKPDVLPETLTKDIVISALDRDLK